MSKKYEGDRFFRGTLNPSFFDRAGCFFSNDLNTKLYITRKTASSKAPG